jgi:hypothetical protein
MTPHPLPNRISARKFDVSKPGAAAHLRMADNQERET